MRKTLTLVIILLSISFVFFQSCTYDYFEDETNYLLYVSEVPEGVVSDCHVLVYNKAGNLAAIKSFVRTNNKDPKLELGLFGFRLLPGDYKVYCFTNTDNASFTKVGKLEESSLILNQSDLNKDYYVEPSDILFQNISPQIVNPNILETDTASLSHYTGRVTVRFKKMPIDVSKIESVQLVANNAATKQYLKEGTTTTVITDKDKIYDKSLAPVQTNPEYYELDYRFFPTVENKNMSFEVSFFDKSNESLAVFPVNIVDKEGMPLDLLAGQRIIIEIESYTIINISIIGWDEDILSSDTNME